MSADTWTCGSVLKWAVDDFKSKNFDTPRLEAELLLSFALNCGRIELYTQFDRPLTEDELKAYRDVVKKRRGGVPAAYIMGSKEFWSLEFEVNEHVLIPRPDTETLVSTTLEHVKEGPILDLCTGSGCVAISLATELPEVEIHATDVSDQALKVAKRNVEKHSLEDRVMLKLGDLYDACNEQTKYKAIVANPPYVTDRQYETLTREVHNEPKLALLAADDGFASIETIICQSPNHLEPGGFLAIEMDPAQTGRAIETGQKCLGKEGTIQNDLAGTPRVVYWVL